MTTPTTSPVTTIEKAETLLRCFNGDAIKALTNVIELLEAADAKLGAQTEPANEDLPRQLAAIENIVRRAGFATVNNGTTITVTLRHHRVNRNEVIDALSKADIDELVTVSDFWPISIAPIN